MLLLSANFLASAFVWDKELPFIEELQAKGKTKVVPLLLSSCDWKETKYAKMQAAPTDPQTMRLKPISEWSNQDKAWQIVIDSINKLLKD